MLLPIMQHKEDCGISVYCKEYSFLMCVTHIVLFRAVFWVVLPCKMIVDRRFRGAYCLHHQGELEISHIVFSLPPECMEKNGYVEGFECVYTCMHLFVHLCAHVR
jgi:hypothetical protein